MSKYDFFFDRSPTNLGMFIVNKVSGYVLEHILKYSANLEKVLEIGPGNGYFAKYFSKKNISYTCYEPNEKIRSSLSNLGVIIRSEYAPPILEADNSFDVVVISHVLEHMPSSEIAFQLISETYRVLREGGILILFCPDARSWKQDFFDVDYTHSFITTPNRVRSILDDNRFHIVKMRSIFGCFGSFPGFVINWMNNAILTIAISFFQFQRRLLKMKITFHANTFIIAKKVNS